MSYIHWLRSRIGHRKTIITYASLVLRDAQGGVLLQRRTDFNVWGLPGGVLEPGETILDCARRETLEETGLLAGDLRLVGVYADPSYDSIYPNGDQVQQYTVCFKGQVAGGEMRPDGVENSAQAFFSPDTIPFNGLPIFYNHMLRDALSDNAPAFQPPFACPELVDQIKDLRPLLGHELMIASGAMSVVVNSDRKNHLDLKILMVKRTDDGEWSIPGGYTHLGENPAWTAMREVQEETGIEIEVERILGIHSPAVAWQYPNGDRTQAVITIFRAHPVGGALQADQTETSQVAWMSPAQILALDTHPSLQRLNQAAMRCLASGIFISG